MKLNGVQMGAEDAKKLAEFYTKAFGEPKWAMPGDWYGWDLGSGHIFLARTVKCMVRLRNHKES